MKKFFNIFKFSEYKLRRYDFLMIIVVAALCILGYLVLNSAMANDIDHDSTMRKQLMAMGIGAFIMLFLSLVDYHFIMRIAPFIYIVVVVFLILVLLFGETINYATRWLKIGNLGQLQPSEFAKVGLILVFAAFFYKIGEKINKPLYLLLALALFSIPAFLVFTEPDLSTTLVIAFVFICMLYIAKISYKWILAALIIMIPIAVFLIADVQKEEPVFFNEYQQGRVMSWLFPDEYSSSGLTTQQDNSVLAISSGQLNGKGLNNTSFESVKNGNFLSEENNDFIFAVLGEELGFVGSMLLIGLILLLVVESFRIGFRARDMAGRLIAVGFGVLIAFQAFVNIGVASGFLPNTGLPLPFVSAGMSSLLSLFIGLGVVLNVGLQRKNKESFW